MGSIGVLPLDEAAFDRDRFWSHVVQLSASGCWMWTGAPDRCGYGRFGQNGRSYRAHRVACVLAGKELSVDQVVDHLCRNRLCVNPSHLEPTTVAVNTARGFGPTARAAAARLVDRCANGHDINAVGLHKQGRTWTCAECGRERVRRYKARRKLAA